MNTKMLQTTVATTALAISILAGTGVAAANPCESDRAFAETNGCNNVYESRHAGATGAAVRSVASPGDPHINGRVR